MRGKYWTGAKVSTLSHLEANLITASIRKLHTVLHAALKRTSALFFFSHLTLATL
jgi:hypothetical protein